MAIGKMSDRPNPLQPVYLAQRGITCRKRRWLSLGDDSRRRPSPEAAGFLREGTTMTEELSGAPEPAVDIVICTYNRASCLDGVLTNLSRQGRGAGVRWRVLVVDNASTNATAEVVAIHRTKSALPGLRYVFEPMPGLTAARQRGARETTAPWIAFVDDDNFLDSRWLEAIGAHGEAGGIGGKVVLDWEV